MPKKIKIPETEEGTILFNIDPIILKDHYEMDYVHSYAQDTPFFTGLANGVLLGCECKPCHYRYATPRRHCMYCGKETAWFELPKVGRIHSWTTCYFGSQAFLKETPYNLILVEFQGVDTLFLSRLIGVDQEHVDIGLTVKPRFMRNSKFKATDVYFVLSDEN